MMYPTHMSGISNIVAQMYVGAISSASVMFNFLYLPFQQIYSRPFQFS